MINSYTPKNREELFQALSLMTGKSKVVAGTTDFGIHLQKGNVQVDSFLYLGYMEETRNIVEEERYVEIGAYITHTELEKSPIIQKYFSAISDASADVGSLQIRNNGTIGGNIANASPAGDLLPVLFMLQAKIVIANKDGSIKEVDISDFILAPGRTLLQLGEVILKFKMEKRKNFISAFFKLGSRKKLTISRIGCTMGIVLEKGRVEEVDIYIGAISLKPVKFEGGEEFLKKKKIEELFLEETKETLVKLMSDLIFKVTPEKFDRNYKMWASKSVIYDMLEILKKRV